MPPFRYTPGGAASRSQIPAWQQFLRDLDRQVPGSGRRGGRSPWVLTSEQGSDADVLRRAETRFENKRREAQALGVEGDGSAPGGLLTSLLGALDAPRQAVFDTIIEPVAGALGVDTEGAEGVGDLVPIDDDDPLWERVLKRGVGFAGDVATDPLTYVTAGTATIGKRAASEAVEKAGRELAEQLGEDAVRKWSGRSLRHRAARAVEEEGSDRLAKETADELAAAARRKPPTFGGSQAEWEAGLGRAQFGAAAAEAYQAGGSTGLRRFLSAELGEEAGERAFASLPREIQGGVRVRVPFAKDHFGAPKSVGFGGGGTGAERLLGRQAGETIGDVFERSHVLRNRMRASRMGRAVADRFTGRGGELYGAMVSSLVRKAPDDLTGIDWAAYAGERAARKGAQELGTRLHQQTLRAMGRAKQFTNDAPDPEAAYRAFEDWFNRPDRLRQILDEGGFTVENGRMRIPGAEGLDLDENEVQGLFAAVDAHEHLRQMLQEQRAAGLTVGEIDDYVARIITEEELAAKEAAKPVRRSAGQAGSGSGFNPTKTREGRAEWTEVRVVADESGNPRLEMRDLSPQEVNRVESRPVFESDPLTILAKYGDAARKLSTRVKYANLLREYGLVVEGGTEWQRFLRGRHTKAAGRALEAAGRQHADYLGQAVRDAERTLEQARRQEEEAQEALRLVDEPPAEPTPEVLRRPRGEHVADVEARAVARAEARLRAKAARDRARRAREQLEEARRLEEQAAREEAPVEFLLRAGMGEDLYRILFTRDGRIDDVDVGMGVDETVADALAAAGWERRQVVLDEDEWRQWTAGAIDFEHATVEERTVQRWLPRDEDTLRRAQRVAYQQAVRRGEELGDWQEWAQQQWGREFGGAVAPREQAAGRSAVSGRLREGETVTLPPTGEVRLGGELPSDPDEFARAVRFIEEMEQVGWRLRWKAPYRDEPGGWYLRNLAGSQQGGRKAAAGRAAAVVARLRELGWDLPDAHVPVGRLSQAQERAVRGVLSGFEGLRFDTGKGGRLSLSGTDAGLRQAADLLDDAAETVGGRQARTLAAAARKMREAAESAAEGADAGRSLVEPGRTPRPLPATVEDFLPREARRGAPPPGRRRPIPPDDGPKTPERNLLWQDQADNIVRQWSRGGRTFRLYRVGESMDLVDDDYVLRVSRGDQPQAAAEVQLSYTDRGLEVFSVEVPEGARGPGTVSVLRELEGLADELDAELFASTVVNDRLAQFLGDRRLWEDVSGFVPSGRRMADMGTLRGFRRRRVDEFVGDMPDDVLFDPAVRREVGKRARRQGRQQFDEAFRRAVEQGRVLPQDVVESATPSTAGRALRARERTVEEARRRLARSQARRQQAARRVDELRAEVDRVAADRQQLATLVQRLTQEADPERQFEAFGTLMEGLRDFHARHVDRYAKDMAELTRESRRRLKAARNRARELAARSERAGRRARGGREDVDEAGRLWQELGLQQIGEVRQSSLTTEQLSSLPPELDVTFAPESLRLAVEKFYKASRPNEDVKQWLDGVYRPLFGLWKIAATVGRGPGYHVRNLIGAVWNNFLGDISAADHRLAARMVRARRTALDQARAEKADELARRLGLSEGEAAARVVDDALHQRVDELLQEQLGGVEVARGLTLYDVHRMSADNQVQMHTRPTEGLHAMIGEEPSAAAQLGGGRANLFRRTRDEADLNRAQRTVNFLADNPAINVSKGWAELSEEFVRNAAFIGGLRRYGASDGGRVAANLSRGLHFDYQDLSETERWTRNTLVPFYVWSRHNVPLQFRALFTSPGKAHRLVMANDAARDVLGDDEADVVPEWMQERLGWVSQLRWQGSPIVLGIESPLVDVNRFIKTPDDLSASGLLGAVGGSLREVTSNLSPAVKAPIELVTGTDTFTGAKFNPEGTPAPWWYRLLPGVPKRTDPQGQVRGSDALIGVLQDAIPWLGLADRAIPASPRMRERYATNLVSLLAPVVGASTLTPRQKAGELRSRSERLERAMDWGPASDARAFELAQELLDIGYSPEQVNRMLREAGWL